MGDTVIKVEGAAKKFCRRLRHSMYYGTMDVARGMLGLESRTELLRQGEFWAVDGVSLELKRGETMGLIGPNGSGKSTLLRLLNGIYPPDRGRIEMRGRVGALISVGAGFHPLMTGRENIYLNGAIMGMGKAEINRKFDEIVDFADIGKFLDSPVKTYSSGMYVRLGFAVAIHCEPDILLVDEVLAVGDAAFRNKCLAKIREVRENGAASLIVSHNLDTVRFMSQRVIALEGGSVVDEGEPESVILGYEGRMIAREREAAERSSRSARRISSGEITIESAKVFAEDSGPEKEVPCGRPFCFELVFNSMRRIEAPLLSLGVLNAEGVQCIWNVSAEDGFELPPVEGRRKLRVLVADNSLVPGSYQIQLSIRERSTMETLERLAGVAHFSITGNRKSRGIVQSRCAWEIKELVEQ